MFEVADKEQQLQKIEKKIEQPDFWEDNLEARRFLKERKLIRDTVDGWTQLKQQLEENNVLLELAI
ncbi:MAG: PCRF domain-containing protein, partial [Deltaproteobacteria bacterium]|nr:PCRF domain-containing protein [Deltaproteobacteria bacterium]